MLRISFSDSWSGNLTAFVVTILSLANGIKVIFANYNILNPSNSFNLYFDSSFVNVCEN